MRAICPLCGAYGPLEIFLVEDEARQAALAVHGLPGTLPRLIWAYLGLWRKPGASKVMTWRRVGKVLRELTDLAMADEVQWKGGRVVPNSAEFWVQGITLMLDKDAAGKLERPIENNNYLRAVAYELAQKAWEKEVRNKEEAIRSWTRSRVEQPEQQDWQGTLQIFAVQDRTGAMERGRAMYEERRKKGAAGTAPTNTGSELP